MQAEGMDLTTQRLWGALAHMYQEKLSRGKESPQLWKLFALALVSDGDYEQAARVIKKILEETPSDVTMRLLLIKIYVLHLGEHELALEHALEAHKPQFSFMTKSLESLAVSYAIASQNSLSEVERKENHRRALNLFEEVVFRDPTNSNAFYNLALHCAHARKIPEAINHAVASLRMNPEFVEIYILLSLLYSSTKDSVAAIDTCRVGLAEFPNHPELLYTTAKLFEMFDEKAKAIDTYAATLAAYKKSKPTPEEKIKHLETHSSNFLVPQLGDLVDDFRPKQVHPKWKSKWQTHLDRMLDLWLSIAHCYLLAGLYKDAATCLQEAKNISVVSPDVLFYEGLLAETQGESEAALGQYTNALGIDCNHIKSLIQTAVVYTKKGSIHTAKGYLDSALQLDEYNHITWFHMAQTLQALQKNDTAAEAFHTALSLEATAPARPFGCLRFHL